MLVTVQMPQIMCDEINLKGSHCNTCIMSITTASKRRQRSTPVTHRNVQKGANSVGKEQLASLLVSRVGEQECDHEFQAVSLILCISGGAISMIYIQ